MSTTEMDQSVSDKQTILVVDDDLHILEVMEARLTSAELRVITATNVPRRWKCFSITRWIC